MPLSTKREVNYTLLGIPVLKCGSKLKILTPSMGEKLFCSKIQAIPKILDVNETIFKRLKTSASRNKCLRPYLIYLEDHETIIRKQASEMQRPIFTKGRHLGPQNTLEPLK